MTKRIFIIAGEASGDLLGSKLIRELKAQLLAKNEEVQFVGVGGKLMKQQGLESIFPMEDLSVMGFLEVVPHLPKLINRINQTVREIENRKPDYLITIDSPDFNFRVVKKLKNFLGKKIHLIAPSVWAYREERAEKISKLYDLLLAILPFEPPYFERYGLKTVFVGHPIMENAPDFSQKESINAKFRSKHNISESDILLCLTPGSRNSEVKRIFPEFIGAVNLLKEKNPNLKVVIPFADKTENLVKEMAKKLQVEYFLVEQEEKKSAFFACNFALAKSGTNTLELALYKLPMIIAYKVNFLTHFLIKRMIKIKFANLLNLVLNKEIIPEMLQDKCKAQQIANVVENLIFNKLAMQEQIDQGALALKTMGFDNVENPSQKAANEILKL